MYGNCLTFAICDFIKNGGELVISFSRFQRIPHFAVQRNGIVHDLEIIKFVLYVFLYNGEPRTTNAEFYDHVKCKRYLLLKMPIKQNSLTIQKE